jgi:hypothetical protein
VSDGSIYPMACTILMSACHDGLVDTPHHAIERGDWKAAIAP